MRIVIYLFEVGLSRVWYQIEEKLSGCRSWCGIYSIYPWYVWECMYWSQKWCFSIKALHQCGSNSYKYAIYRGAEDPASKRHGLRGDLRARSEIVLLLLAACCFMWLVGFYCSLPLWGSFYYAVYPSLIYPWYYDVQILSSQSSAPYANEQNARIYYPPRAPASRQTTPFLSSRENDISERFPNYAAMVPFPEL